MSPIINKTNTIALICAMCLLLGVIVQSGCNAMQLVEQVDQSGRSSSAAATLGGQSGGLTATVAVVENPEITIRVLENLLRSILYSTQADYQASIQSAQKRGLDLGISRGFSGSQAGKHLMGLSAASFANGPGRR